MTTKGTNTFVYLSIQYSLSIHYVSRTIQGSGYTTLNKIKSTVFLKLKVNIFINI